jgi:SNF2 family DNA or RNA helicase
MIISFYSILRVFLNFILFYKFKGTWGISEDYFRLDGSTLPEIRLKWCKDFNDLENPRARIFLLSMIAGGTGINPTGENHAVIFYASWNQTHDLQSVFRIYR